jgi:arylformamidase
VKLIDLSQPLYDGSPNCPAHPPVRSTILKDHPERGWRVEFLALSNHSGSHVDAPLHKIAGGPSLDEMPLEQFAGPALIADLRGLAPSTPISIDMLRAKLRQPVRGMIVLVATGWGQKRAHTHEWLYDSPCLSPEAARWLVESGINGVGIDHYSIGGMRDEINPVVHEILLGAGVWIVEELRFSEAALAVPQPCRFWALPINLRGHTGAFCRPVIELPG